MLRTFQMPLVLNEFGKCDKMRGLPDLINFNSIKQENKCYILFII